METMNKILMLTPEGEEVEVDQKNFDAAIKSKLEPALEYVTPEGEIVVVRKSNFDQAEKQGLVMRPIYEAQKQPMESPGKISAIGAGAAQWSPFGGFREEISGAMESPKGAAQAVGELFGADYSKSPELQKYRKAKQRYKDIEEAAWEQEPAAYSAGGLLSLLSGFGAGAVSKAPTVAQTLKLAGGTGAAQQVGETEGDIVDMLKAGLLGGTAGVAVGSIVPGVQKGMQSLATGAERQAERSAYAATGGLKSDINKLYKSTPEEVGRELLKRKAVGLGTRRGSEKIGRRVSDELGKFSAEEDALMRTLQNEAVDPAQIADAIRQRAAEAASKPGVGNQSFANRLNREARVIQKVYGGYDEFGQPLPMRTLSPEEALGMKRSYDSAGKYQSKINDLDAAEATRESRRAVTRAIDEMVEGARGPEVAQGYQQSRRGAKLLLDAQAALEEQAKREQSNLNLGLRDSLFGTLGATVGAAAGGPGGGAIGGAGGLVLSRLMRDYGPSTTAAMMQKASEVISSKGLQDGIKTLTSLYGPEVASDLFLTLLDTGNFNDPASLANLVGSAVLGSDLTRGVASVGAGIGGAMEGRPFAEGMEERYRELEQNPSQLEGVLSMAGAMLPTGRAGSLPSKIIRGVQGLDELLSDTGKQKNAPNLMNIKMPDGTEFGSKIGDSKKAKELLDGLKLKNENEIKITSVGDNGITGHIDHPDYPKHTKFSFNKDDEGLWVLNSNYRDDKFANVPELKGSSTDMRRAVAQALGGIGSDWGGRNSKVGQLSYLRDEQAMPTSPNPTDYNFRREGPITSQTRFFTPGDEQQKEDFIKAFQESYKSKPEDVDRTKMIKDLFGGATRSKDLPDFMNETLTDRRITTMMNDPNYADLHGMADIVFSQNIDTFKNAEKRGLRPLVTSVVPRPRGHYLSVIENSDIDDPKRIRYFIMLEIMNERLIDEKPYEIPEIRKELQRLRDTRELSGQEIELLKNVGFESQVTPQDLDLLRELGKK